VFRARAGPYDEYLFRDRHVLPRGSPRRRPARGSRRHARRQDSTACRTTRLTTAVAWLGAFAYTLQIYYDFSGYSDMAIGIGRMMGFEFSAELQSAVPGPKNITEFWRRWHIDALSRWFRDYVYIPLGGNRRGPGPHLTSNLVVVFFLCGLWHGAAYQFVVWGPLPRRSPHHRAHHDGALSFRAPRAWQRKAIAFLLVLIGWVFFRAATLSDAVHFPIRDGRPRFAPATTFLSARPFYLTGDKIAFLLAGAVIAVFSIRNASHGFRPKMSVQSCCAGAVFDLLSSLTR